MVEQTLATKTARRARESAFAGALAVTAMAT
jgi:hypothetical protein